MRLFLPRTGCRFTWFAIRLPLSWIGGRSGGGECFLFPGFMQYSGQALPYQISGGLSQQAAMDALLGMWWVDDEIPEDGGNVLQEACGPAAKEMAALLAEAIFTLYPELRGTS